MVALKPYLQDADFTLYNGDAVEVLRELPAESVHMCLTSPPFFGLRDYGTGTWEGGDAGCDHVKTTLHASRDSDRPKGWEGNFRNTGEPRPISYGDTCGKCGARRVDRQIGLEATPEAWVASLVAVFDEVKRVLRKDGTLWVECGDSYNSGTSAKRQSSDVDHGAWQLGSSAGHERMNVPGMKVKDLIGQPFLLAFALREAGWYWRNVCIWHKPNPMPESVRDRFTISHSYVLLFSKQPRYFFDQEAIRESYNPDGRLQTTVHQGPNSLQHRDGERWPERPQTVRAKELFRDAGLTEAHLTAIKAVGMNDAGKAQVNQGGYGKNDPEMQRLADEAKDALGGYYREFLLPPAGRNARSVWSIATEPLPFEHYAAFPQALAERCIKAGTSERGCCPECGAAWVRETSTDYTPNKRGRIAPHGTNGAGYVSEGRASDGMSRDTEAARMDKHVTTTGWRPTCDCNKGSEHVTVHPRISDLAASGSDVLAVDEAERGLGQSPGLTPIPCTILDPFLGSGTSALVARRLNRHCIGIELNKTYCELIARRTQQLSLEAETV